VRKTGLGVVGAVTFIFQVLNEQVIPGTNHSVAGQDMPGLVWGTAMAVLVPTAAAIILPRQFGVALLAGWIGTVVAGMVFYTGVVHSLTGLTLLALLAVIIPFARAAPPARASALAVDEPSANT